MRGVAFAILLTVGCGGGLPAGAQARSFTGKTLFPPPLADDVRAKHEANLATAKVKYDAAPLEPNHIIWYGRRLAYLGKYREAIEVYTKGLERHPVEPRLLRHRGHRYISVRELDRAIRDFERAAELRFEKHDEVEPDGLPNPAGIPTSTLHTNIYYHLGLAHYLKGEYTKAERAYFECLKWSKNDDMRVATVYWQYLTFQRLGRLGDAKLVLEPITTDIKLIENTAYLQLLLLYKGELTPEDLGGETGSDAIDDATIGYGIAQYYAHNDRHNEARKTLRRVVAGEQWAAFGYIAADADLARATGK